MKYAFQIFSAFFIAILLMGAAKSKKEDANKMKIRSVIIELHEEEGGRESHEYFPNGYVKLTGENTNRGFSLKKKKGWYLYDNAEVLQGLFDRAHELHTRVPEGISYEDIRKVIEEKNPDAPGMKIGTWQEVTLTFEGGQWVHYDFYRDDLYRTRPAHLMEDLYFRFLDESYPEGPDTKLQWIQDESGPPPERAPVIKIK